MFMQCGDWIVENNTTKANIDNIAIEEGYISITPLTADRTNIEVFNELLKK